MNRSESSEEWELSKENIRPIQQGRKPKVLKVALSAHPEDVILHQRQSFENELRTYSGDDPLAVWCEYIKWVEQNFPKGGREGHIKELIERCLSILKNEKKYYDDERFVDIMLRYAIMSGKPIDVYNYMFSNNIGCKLAKLFIEWSWELEQMNILKKADEILNEGLCRRAEPYEKIQLYYKDFEIRLAGKIKANVDQNICNTENSRSAFAMLKPQKKNSVPILRTGEAVVDSKKMPLLVGRQQPLPKSNTASIKVPFKIYDSENANSFFPQKSQSKAPADLTSENYKENERIPSKWSKVRVKPHGMHLKMPGEVNPLFKFHCDEETEQDFHALRSVPSTSKILTTRRQTPSSPISFFEPPDPLTKDMYPKNKIYGGAEEFSLEEIRAAEWFDKRKKTEQEMSDAQTCEKGQRGDVFEKEVDYLSKKVEKLHNYSMSLEDFNSVTNTLPNLDCNIVENVIELKDNYKIGGESRIQMNSIDQRAIGSNDELNVNCAVASSNNIFESDANQSKKTEDVSKMTKVPFTFYEDPTNEL